jgi:hypothetical protein
MAEGVTTEQIDKQFYAPLFQRAADLDPSIMKDRDQLARHLAKMAQSRR